MEEQTPTTASAQDQQPSAQPQQPQPPHPEQQSHDLPGFSQFQAAENGQPPSNVLPPLQSLVNNQTFTDLSVPVGNLPADASAFPDLLPGTVPSFFSDGLQQLPPFPEQGLPPIVPQMDIPSMNTMAMLANGHTQPTTNDASISEDEIALYDRQIRLWGMKAQRKIRCANILLITLRSLSTEIAKNIVLAGISSLTILDGGVVTPLDLGAGFFVSESNSETNSLLGKNRAQAAVPAIQRLNPRVTVRADPEDIRTKPSSYFAAFDVVIATDLDASTLNIVNTATRLHGKPFYAAGQHGMNGFIFNDLIEHEYVIQRDAGNIVAAPGPETRTRSVVNIQTKREAGKNIQVVTKKELYSTFFLAQDAPLPREYQSLKRRRRLVSPILSCFRALWEFTRERGTSAIQSREDITLFTRLATEKHSRLGLPPETLTPQVLRQFLQGVGCEVAAVAAILGGQLAQDVINVLGQTQQPIQNMVVFDGETMHASMFALHGEGDLGKELFSLTAQATNGHGHGAGVALPPSVSGGMAGPGGVQIMT